MGESRDLKTQTNVCLAGVTLCALVACDPPSTSSGTPSVGSVSGLSSFEGARAGQAEMGIQSLGYEVIRTEGLTAYWVNRETGVCARITTSQGRYSDVTMLPPGDC